MQQRQRVLLLGIGSPFGADRIGWLAIDALAQTDLAAEFPHLELHIEQSDRPGSSLLTRLQNVDTAILIDAMQSGAAIGTIRCYYPEELTPEIGLSSSHGFGVAEALALGRQLGQLPAQVMIFGIEIGVDAVAEINMEDVMPSLQRMLLSELSGL